MPFSTAFGIAGSQFKFSRCGESRLELSELLPNLATVADRLAVIRSMYTEPINHDPAVTFLQTGRIHAGFELCLSRPPDADELLVMRELIEAQRGAGASDEAIWHGVARTLLNLDELITRE